MTSVTSPAASGPAPRPLVHSRGLAVFRIAFCLALAGEVAQMFRFRHLLFDTIPFFEPIRIPVGAILLVWGAALAALALGIDVRRAAAFNYAFTVILLGFGVRTGGYSYHADSFYLVGSLLLVLLPCDRVLSVDAWRGRSRLPPEVSGDYSLALKLVLAGVYLDSFTWKLASPMWRAGLGLWVPAAHLFPAYRDLSPLLSSELVSRFLGYAVLAFEGLFPFLIWFRRFERVVIAAGIAIHVGILLVFPMPLFSLVVIAFYLGIVPPKRLPASAPPAPTPDAGAGREATGPWPAGIRIFLRAWVAACLLMSLQSPLWGIPAFRSDTPGPLVRSYHRLNNLLYYFAGIQPHGVFHDTYFSNYDRQTMLVFRRGESETPLPYTDRAGFARGHLSGRVQCMWTWYSLNPRRDAASLARELVRYATFWAVEEKIDVQEGFVSILRRPIDLSLTEWRPNWSERNRSLPWTEVGRIEGRPGSFVVHWQASSDAYAATAPRRP
jgi:hypothetical protein